MGPLVAAVDRAGGPGELIPWPRDIRGRAIARAYSRAKSADGGRIGVALADRLAVELLGVHPAVIWHDWSRA